MSKIFLSKSKIFLLATTSLLVGIIAGTFYELQGIFAYTAIIFSVTAIILLRKSSVALGVLLCIISLTVGCILMNISRYEMDGQRHMWQGRQIYFQGVIIDEPQQRENNIRTTIRLDNIDDNDLDGSERIKITTTLSSYESISYGDIVTGECVLEVPRDREGAFSYSGYLSMQGIGFTCQKGKIVRVSVGVKDIRYYLFSIKQSLSEIIYRHMSPSSASLLAGILMGKRDATPVEVSDAFSETGLTHIVAVSGYNISIVIAIISSLITRMGMHKKYSIFLISVFIAIFVIFTGGSSAAVRAGIMGVSGLLALQVGRLPSSPNALMASAIVMAVINPWIVRYDIGFQLSFLATLGLIVITPRLEEYFKKIPNIIGARDILVQTLAAIISTSPIIAWYFGTLSLVAPIANLLVVPVIPLIMSAGFLWVVCALIIGLIPVALPSLVIFLGIPTMALLTYCILVAQWLSRLPFASVELQIPLWSVLAYYVFIGVFIVKKRYYTGQTLVKTTPQS